AAYVYVRSGTAWTEQAKLSASDGAPGDHSGYSVALSGDTALVGAYSAANQTGAAYVYSTRPVPTLSVNPSSAPPGASVAFTGSTFAAGETVNLYLTSPVGNLLGTGTADSAGSFVITVQVKSAPYGPYPVFAVGQTSGDQANTTFSITPRLAVSPKTGAPGASVTCQGYGFGASELVNVYWRTPTGSYLFHGNATSDTRGSFRLTFTIPASAPVGANLVFGKGQTTSAVGKAQVTVQ
ncbi:MAG: FG-GAP repeat protein, partial [Bryobacteraceae bacterium]